MVPPQQPCWGLTLSAFALLLPLVALTACGGEGEGTATGAAPAPAPPSGAPAAPLAPPDAERKPAPASTLAALGATAGFTPLPSPQQVVGPLAKGPSNNPFAPLPPQQVGSPTASLPKGFLFTGVIQSRGLTQAIVYLGGTDTTISQTVTNNVSTKLGAVNSGEPTTTLCVGPRGLCPGGDQKAPPLPTGWSVTGIDRHNGVLSLRQGRLPVKCRLVLASVRPPYQAPTFTSTCTGPGVKAAAPATATSSPASAPGPASQSTPPANATPPAP